MDNYRSRLGKSEVIISFKGKRFSWNCGPKATCLPTYVPHILFLGAPRINRLNYSLFVMPQSVFPRTYAKCNALAQTSFESTRNAHTNSDKYCFPARATSVGLSTNMCIDIRHGCKCEHGCECKYEHIYICVYMNMNMNMDMNNYEHWSIILPAMRSGDNNFGSSSGGILALLCLHNQNYNH